MIFMGLYSELIQSLRLTGRWALEFIYFQVSNYSLKCVCVYIYIYIYKSEYNLSYSMTLKTKKQKKRKKKKREVKTQNC